MPFAHRAKADATTIQRTGTLSRHSSHLVEACATQFGMRGKRTHRMRVLIRVMGYRTLCGNVKKEVLGAHSSREREGVPTFLVIASPFNDAPAGNDSDAPGPSSLAAFRRGVVGGSFDWQEVEAQAIARASYQGCIGRTQKRSHRLRLHCSILQVALPAPYGSERASASLITPKLVAPEAVNQVARMIAIF
ncbi:hypothetical protein Efla_002073 [Eimeria flavescens]